MSAFARWPLFTGRKPSKEKAVASRPLPTSAVMTAQGPGKIVYSRPASAQARTRRAPGSEIEGVPATGLTAAELDAALEIAGGRAPRETVSSLLAACDTARYGPPHALPSADACRDALSAASQVLAGR